MKGDFSRLTFQPTKHFRSVRQQQGRVQLDADWNEQIEIQGHREQVTLADVIGPVGVPAHPAQEFKNFQIRLDPNNNTRLQIAPGQMYVNGLLCQQDAPQGVIDLIDQPHLTPNSPLILRSNGQQALFPATSGLYLVYLDVWERHVTAAEDPSIREEALGGPDTTTRTQTVWQVRLLQVGNENDPAKVTDTFAAWNTLVAPSSGTLRARAHVPQGTTDPCLVPPGGGYRRLENQLYRVEIHDTGAGDTATFKWSRDNGAMVTQWISQNNNDLIIATSGPDSIIGFAAGQWVELIDDGRELRGEPGTLVQISKVEGQVLTIDDTTATGVTDIASFPVRPRIRRWDLPPTGLLTTAISNVNEGYIPLEDGVEIKFDAGTYRTGDYWLIPARTLSADIVWPQTQSGPKAVTPQGIKHSFSRLALVKSTNAGVLTVMNDGRQQFSSLTQVQQMLDILLKTSDAFAGVKITAVELFNNPTAVRNDTSIQATTFADGITVRLDRAVDPQTLNQATCYMTLDLPYPFTTDERNYWGGLATPVFGFQSLKLDGTLSTSEAGGGTVIVWKPSANSDAFVRTTLLQRMSTDNRGTRVLARLTLKGSFIWAADDPARLLDGDTFGSKIAGNNNTNITLPTGDNRRGGDFEMWFWLVPAMPTISALVVNPTSVLSTATSTGTLTLSAVALAGGAVVGLSSSNAAVVVPSQVMVAGGSTTASFNITTTSVPANVTATITAQLTGSPNRTATLTVTPPKLANLTLNSTNVTSGTSVTGTVTLDAPAAAGGAVITLSATGAGVKTIPATVTVLQGTTTATFTMATENLTGGGTTATINAVFGGITKTATLVVSPTSPLPQTLTLTASIVTGGAGLSGTITLNKAALTGGTAISMTSSNSAVRFSNGSTSMSMTIPAGQTTTTFTLSTVAVTSSAISTIAGTISGTTASSTMTVSPAVLSSVTNTPNPISPGGTGTGRVNLSGPSAVTQSVSLSSGSTTVVTVPSSVTVPAGANTATFAVNGAFFTGANRTTTISATMNGFTRSVNVTVEGNVKDKESEKFSSIEKINQIEASEPLSFGETQTESASTEAASLRTEGTASAFITPEERPQTSDEVLKEATPVESATSTKTSTEEAKAETVKVEEAKTEEAKPSTLSVEDEEEDAKASKKPRRKREDS